ncbi:MAG: hypothetical protein N2648_01700 [Aquificaceae bacterium]|nr:hypothetical protein [Aquificaceae bacterium]MCS7196177.1 hypothetical protein [Aquificaceae bacterium]MCX7989341.1 hypothetical protein [Aquificaceae bacterium]MDW8032624.1 hypothetical protein [Aquificaceae bacterium]MDW8294791.1 hypothetical protein [Aquificaceae bacterium]
MRRLNIKEDKALAFIAGLVYGYRNTPMELKVLSLEDFSEEKHREDRVYYLNRKEGKLYECFDREVSHVCVLREDKVKGKVSIFIYKKTVKPLTAKP